VSITVALAGDTMLGRKVGERLAADPARPLVAPEVAEIVRDAGLFLLNLECCIATGGEPWPAPGKPFFFRAPPAAAEVLAGLGVDCVTLANNHALDFGRAALSETLERLAAVGIAYAGAGPDLRAARRPVRLRAPDGTRVTVFGVTDHPRDYAAGPDSAGVAHADLHEGVPGWLTEAVAEAAAVGEVVLVSPHWGPNMTDVPVPHVRRAGEALMAAGATLIAGHSAHVFHGVQDGILWDMGDFLDDYAVDPSLRNDLSLLFLVEVEAGRPRRLRAVPLKLEFCFTRLAEGEEARWIEERFRRACAGMATEVAEEGGALVVEW
jgi:poly-gamma-glutamate synthesis protein (capsule biosynthesis protein)